MQARLKANQKREKRPKHEKGRYAQTPSRKQENAMRPASEKRKFSYSKRDTRTPQFDQSKSGEENKQHAGKSIRLIKATHHIGAT
jgi:hypothetical protein